MCVFPFFSKDLRGSAKRKNPCIFRVSLAFIPKKQGLEGQGRSQRFFCDCDAHRGPQKSLANFETLHCDLRVRWKVASDLGFRVAISEAKTPSFSGISGDLASSTWKSLAIAIMRFWSAKVMALIAFILTIVTMVLISIAGCCQPVPGGSPGQTSGAAVVGKPT